MQINVALVFGGASVEHEVSVISALQAKESLDKTKYNVVPVYMTKKGDFYTGGAVGDIAEYKDVNALLKKSERVIFVRDGGVKLVRYPGKRFGDNTVSTVDVVLPVVHGTNVEDGALQGFFKTLGVPFAGCDVTASAVGMDKFIMKTVFAACGIPVLPALRFFAPEYADADAVISKVENKFGYPVIVKPVDLGSSVGIGIAHDRTELSDALDTAFSYARCVLVERAVENLRELNCAVLGSVADAQPSEVEEPFHSRPGDILDFKDKYMSGGGSKKTGGGSSGMASLQRQIPADISPELRERVRQLAVAGFKALDCRGVARIDFILDGEDVYLNEINTIPGSLAFYLFEPIGLGYKDMLDRVIDLAFAARREEQNLTFSFDNDLLSGNIKFGGAKK
ncbi:MAG: D-alanine--D-alanine ligase [Clostridia bacterium]|nr:D-alanine--D-alanine ligase [Clostridia bacterium]